MKVRHVASKGVNDGGTSKITQVNRLRDTSTMLLGTPCFMDTAQPPGVLLAAEPTVYCLDTLLEISMVTNLPVPRIQHVIC